MQFITHDADDMHDPRQFLKRKWRSIDQKQTYLRTVKAHVDQGKKLSEAIQRGEEELGSENLELNRAIRDCPEDDHAVKIKTLLYRLNEFSVFFEDKLKVNNVSDMNTEELMKLIETLNREYDEFVLD